MKSLDMSEIRGEISAVSGPTVVVKGMAGVKMHTTCLVGEQRLIGEVIRIEGERATLQVYEDTSGLRLAQEVVSHGKPLTVTLGPGLLAKVFDGIQRPLDAMLRESGYFITRGLSVPAIDKSKRWEFEPRKKAGDRVGPGDVLGTVRESETMLHSVMVPLDRMQGGVIKEMAVGTLDANDPVCVFNDGTTVGLYHEWPVRVARPVSARLPLNTPFVTGQRVFDTLLPVAEGGTAIVPGGFGTGKTVVEQTIAKFARTDIVIYIGCGERGNEMTEVLRELPALKDPSSGAPLSHRTIIIANTSNMPVAARESSIFTGITMAEYYRDMGYRVALMADSLSRWAEALREISSRLEEMPGEEGFPSYLATRLGSFYERAGRVRCLGADERTGSITIISAISPPGGDFSEPVTQASMRFAGTLWALDTDLAYRRHFPAVNWETSYSLHYRELREWFTREVAHDMPELRTRLMGLLQREAEINEVVQIIGMEALQESDRLTLEAAIIARETFLRQSVFNENDAFATFDKQYWMLKAIFAFLDMASKALKRGMYLENIITGPIRARLMKIENVKSESFPDHATALISDMEKEFA